MGALFSLQCCKTEDRTTKHNQKTRGNRYNDFDFESHLRTENDPIEEALHIEQINTTNSQNSPATTESKLLLKNEHQFDDNNDNKTETLSTSTVTNQSNEYITTNIQSQTDDEQTANIQSQTVETLESKTEEINNEQTKEKEKEESEAEEPEESEDAKIKEIEVIQSMNSNSLNIITENEKPNMNDTPSGFRIQIEQLASFDGSNPWVLRKHRDQDSPASATATLKAFSYDRSLMKQKRVTLTNTHNFLWFTGIVQGAVKYAKQESEITKGSLGKILNLLPVPFREKIWEICDIDEDTFIVCEDFEEFVNSLLIATGQIDINTIIDDDDEMFEIRDMSAIFHDVISLTKIFIKKKNVSNTVSKTTPTLSTHGAKQVIMLLRNLDDENDIMPNDISIPLLTGFTKKAIKHSIKYCSRIFWKILTDVWWDEDDEEDIALPYHLDTTKRRHSRRRSKVSDDVRRNLSHTSMSDLFPDLYKNRSIDTDDEDDDQTSISGNFLNVH